MAKTLIKGGQIKLSDFIQALASVDWTSDMLTASAAAIAARIADAISGVAGAMIYRGGWTIAATDSIKKGYVYVYADSANGSIGTGGSAVVLESGDLLIANQDNASITNPSHWTIVEMNLTGAILESNLVDNLVAHIESGNSNALLIAKDPNTGKLKLTAIYPTVSGGKAENGKYVSAISIDSTTGIITVTKASLPVVDLARVVLESACVGTPNGTLKVFTTPEPVLAGSSPAFYINGVKQENGTDYTYSVVQGYGQFTISNTGYVPKTDDIVTCSYVREPSAS